MRPPSTILALHLLISTHAGAAGLNEAQQELDYAVSLDLQKRDEAARSHYRRAIQLNPYYLPAYDKYSLFLFSRNRSSEGVAMLRGGLAKNPKMLELRALLGMHLYRLGKIQEAYKELEVGIKKLERYDVQAVFARCAFLLEKYPVAARTLREYLGSRPAANAVRDHVFNTQLALALMRMGSTKEAEKVVRSVLIRHPKYRQGREAQAELLLRTRRCSEAARVYRQMASTSEPYALELASAYTCLRRYRAALGLADRYLAGHKRFIDKLLGQKPARRRYRRNIRRAIEGFSIRGEAEMKLGHHERALDAFKKVERLSGESEKTMLLIAKALFMMKRNDQVLERLDDALTGPRPAPHVLILALRAAVRAKRASTALRCADHIAGDSKATPKQRYYAGIAYSSAGRFDRAVEQLERSLAAAPGDEQTRRDLIKAYCHQGKRELGNGRAEAAVRLLTKATRLAPRRASVRQDMVIASLAAGKSKQAVAHARRLLRLRPSASSHHLMARALTSAGQDAKALVSYRKARKAAASSRDQQVRLLAEEAVALVKIGLANDGISKVRQALRIVGPKDSRMRSYLGRLLTQAQIHHAGDLLERGRAREVQRVLAPILKSSAKLAPRRIAMARTLITLAKIVGGQARHARRLIKKYADDIGSSLRPAFRRVGPALLEALADGSSPAPKLKRRAAARLEQLASKLSRPARETLQGYAGILHHQLAVQAFRLKQRAKAKTELARAQRLLRAHSNTLRHNKAVVDYYTGNKEAAVKALYGARIQTPMALCNLAVHYERMGDRLKAFELFKQCDTRGVRTFPDLGQLLEMRQMLTGDRVGS